MTRIEVNVQTSERTVIELTPEEIRDAETRSAKERAERAARPPSLEQRVTRLETWAQTMGYTLP
mgnify:CR=1 FL=1